MSDGELSRRLQADPIHQSADPAAHRVVTGLGQPRVDSLDLGVDEDVVFRLVETLPNLRVDKLGVADQPRRTADLAVVRCLAGAAAASLAGAAAASLAGADEITADTAA